MASKNIVAGFAIVSIVALAQPSAVAQLTATDAMTFTGCGIQFAAYPVAKGTLTPLLPPGFEANPFSLLPTNDLGSIPLFVQRCARATDDSGAILLNPVEAWLLIGVQPPVEWRNPGLTAYYWIVRSVTATPELADVYGDWGLGPGGVGTILSERAAVGPVVWADFARIQDDSLSVEIVNENAGTTSAWAGLRARFFGRDASGTIHAADHIETATGRISGIQPSTAVGDEGSVPFDGVHEGLGRNFRWMPTEASWTFSRVTLPPLSD